MLIQYLAMVIIGGLGSVLGACLGAIFVIVLPHLISIAINKLPFLQGLGNKIFELQIGAFGLIMLLFLILEPRGLAGIWARVRFYFQLWPFKLSRLGSDGDEQALRPLPSRSRTSKSPTAA